MHALVWPRRPTGAERRAALLLAADQVDEVQCADALSSRVVHHHPDERVRVVRPSGERRPGRVGRVEALAMLPAYALRLRQLDELQRSAQIGRVHGGELERTQLRPRRRARACGRSLRRAAPLAAIAVARVGIRGLEQVEKAERILLSLPDTEIAGISSRIGTHSSSPTEDLGSMDNGAIIFVHLAPYGERSRTAAQIGDDIRSQIENAFQAQEFEYLVELMRIGPPLGRPFEIRLASNEEEVRAAESLRLQKYLRKIPGVLEVEDDTIAGKNELNLVPDHQLLASR